MFGKKPPFLPATDARTYTITSLILYALFIVLVVYATIALLFPYSRYSFDFNNPNATKNNLFSPHIQDYSAIEKGKVPQSNSLTVYVNDPHVLESATIKISPTFQDKKLPELSRAQVTLNHGWAALFLARDSKAISFPQIKIVEYQGKFYEQRDTALFPFVSAAAAESFVPREKIISVNESQFREFAVSEEILGFRVGTLLSYGDGVFIVAENGVSRPFGSPKILLALGYTFDHVIPANAEEVGIYKRGKIILNGQVHPSGTLFRNRDEQKLHIFQNQTLSPVDEVYGAFLESKNDVVVFSQADLQKESSCLLTKDTFRKSFSCTLPIDFSDGIGEDYQITLENTGSEIDIMTMTIGTQASRKEENARFVLTLLASRILARFGIILE